MARGQQALGSTGRRVTFPRWHLQVQVGERTAGEGLVTGGCVSGILREIAAPQGDRGVGVQGGLEVGASGPREGAGRCRAGGWAA